MQPPSSSAGYDLLRIRPLRALLLWGGFPYLFQAAMLVLLVWLAVLGWGWTAPDGVPDKLYAKNHLTNLLVWGLWWPAMIWLAVFGGRIWCAVCPLELVANVSERCGRRLGVRQRALGRWLRGGALTVVLFVVLQLLVPSIHLHRVPAYTSVFLWIMLAMAVLVGLCWRDRAFCRGFCPIGALLSTYGRGGVLAVRPADSSACEDCDERGCAKAHARQRLDRRSCPSLLHPARLDRSTDCLLCGQCLKSCGPANMRLFLRPLFAAGDAREAVASWPVTAFVMVVSGFATSEVCSEWPAAKAVFLAVPERLSGWLGVDALGGWIEGVWTILALPLLGWTALGLLTVVAGGARNLLEAWRRLALPVAVVVAAGHMAKGLAKFVSWVGHLPHALSQPDGVAASLAMNAETLAKPSGLVGLATVSTLSLLLLAAFTWLACREARLADATGYRRRLAPPLLLAAVYAYVIWGWRLA